MEHLVRIVVATLLGLGSGHLTLSFTKKKDPSGRYLREVGYPLFAAKVAAGFLVGVGERAASGPGRSPLHSRGDK